MVVLISCVFIILGSGLGFGKMYQCFNFYYFLAALLDACWKEILMSPHIGFL